MTTKTIPEISVDTQMVYERLAKAAVGETVSYSELSRLIGRDIQREARPTLQSAMHKALSNRVVFESQRNVGVVRLDDSKIVGTSKATFRRIHRAARKGAKKLASVQDFDALPDGDKAKHNAAISALGAIDLFSKEKTLTRLCDVANGSQSKISIAKTLELFGSKQQ